MSPVRAWRRDEGGATAVEFALVIAPLVGLVFGIIHFGLLIFSINQLNFATEATARCSATGENSSVSTAPCKATTGVPTAAQYFATHYKGATVNPTPSISKVSCGWKVSASASYKISAGFFKKTVPISSTSCFPA